MGKYVNNSSIAIGEMTLHLEIRRNDVIAAKAISYEGTKMTLKMGLWRSPLDEAFCQNNYKVSHKGISSSVSSVSLVQVVAMVAHAQ